MWHRSSYSNQEGGNCVEVATGAAGLTPVRDSKAPQGPVLTFRSGTWAAFMGDLKAARPLA
ncbi:DUF397 domain-containing protein [Streptomyces sp. NPDC029526]|uniref:DUF397 domain-containing protein n=1 Tax=Streptomyces sp. NPDC029526 TaxID=3155728 RepID=UPI0033DBFAD8